MDRALEKTMLISEKLEMIMAQVLPDSSLNVAAFIKFPLKDTFIRENYKLKSNCIWSINTELSNWTKANVILVWVLKFFSGSIMQIPVFYHTECAELRSVVNFIYYITFSYNSENKLLCKTCEFKYTVTAEISKGKNIKYMV